LVPNVWGLYRFLDKRNPVSTLHRAGDAVRHGDSPAFESEANIESIAASYYDQHLLPRHVADGTAEKAGLRERNTAAISRRLRRWIETGRIDPESPRLTLLGEFLHSAILAKSAEVERIRTAHNLAIVTVKLGQKNDLQAELEIKLVRQQGIWRVVEITNIEELIRNLNTQELARVARLNGELEKAASIRGKTNSGPGKWRVLLDSSAQGSVTVIADCTGLQRQVTSSVRSAWTFERPGAMFVDFQCSCATADCPPPNVNIDEFRGRNHTLRRVTPRALD
jgi:hypothetical protein